MVKISKIWIKSEEIDREINKILCALDNSDFVVVLKPNYNRKNTYYYFNTDMRRMIVVHVGSNYFKGVMMSKATEKAVQLRAKELVIVSNSFGKKKESVEGLKITYYHPIEFLEKLITLLY